MENQLYNSLSTSYTKRTVVCFFQAAACMKSALSRNSYTDVTAEYQVCHKCKTYTLELCGLQKQSFLATNFHVSSVQRDWAAELGWVSSDAAVRSLQYGIALPVVNNSWGPTKATIH